MIPMIVGVTAYEAVASRHLLGLYASPCVDVDQKKLIEAHGGPLVLLGRQVVERFELAYLPYSIACADRLMAVLPVRAEFDLSRAWSCLAELLELTRAAEAATC